VQRDCDRGPVSRCAGYRQIARRARAYKRCSAPKIGANQGSCQIGSCWEVI
jgi:hypothetical protein